jgi:hypothetical protein
MNMVLYFPPIYFYGFAHPNVQFLIFLHYGMCKVKKSEKTYATSNQNPAACPSFLDSLAPK